MSRTSRFYLGGVRCFFALFSCLGLSAAAVAGPPEPAAAAPVDFNRDIRPLLSNACYQCHGPDEGQRKAKLRLDRKEDAFAALLSGAPAVVPGKSGESRLFQRITAAEPGKRMPPPKSGKKLSDAQIELIRRWIDEGAVWRGHWSFQKPDRPQPPEFPAPPEGVEPIRNPLDAFIRARLAREGLSPSPPADRVTLIRRATFDLTGLPPTPAEIDAFLADSSTDAYDRLVERLLSSASYGENMARSWLDAVRYGDTHGLHFDNERSLWPYRDWVIRAFNQNLPFDKFTVEQLAGDLLPGATVEQRVATGFNRCNVSTSEGGSIDEEVLVRYAVDRVEATGAVWLGLTVGCAVCHDHKFDPLTQKEFYQLFSFFNSFNENAMDGNALLPPPVLKVPTREQDERLTALRQEIQEKKTRLEGPLLDVDAAQYEWEKELERKSAGLFSVLEPAAVRSEGGASLKVLEDRSVLAGEKSPEQDVYELEVRPGKLVLSALRLEALRDPSLPQGGAGRADNANFVLSELEATVAGADPALPPRKIAFSAALADYSQKGFEVQKAIDGNPATGWAVDGPTRRENRSAVFIPDRPIELEDGGRLSLRLVQAHGSRHTLGRIRVSISTDPALIPPPLGPWSVLGPFGAASGSEAFAKDFGPEAKLDLSAAYADGKVKWVEKPDLLDGQVNALKGNIAATYFYRRIHALEARKMEISLGSDDGLKVFLNGKVVLEKDVTRGVAADQDRLALDLQPGENHLLVKVINGGGAYAFYFRRIEDGAFGEVLELAPLLNVPSQKRSAEEKKQLRDRYRQNHSPEWRELNGQVAALSKKAGELDAQVPGTMVTQEMEKRRDAFVLIRGDYTRKGEKVAPGVPAILPPLPDGAPPNRLGLAQWLVHPDHPLTARVTVNRFWQSYFGTGIVKTSNDFGAQGEWPVHPECLDWLATEFRESGWDVKHIQKLIVTSAAYRQSAKVTPASLEKDPDNRLLSRGPRFRLDAEVIRDSVLSVSGLLVSKIGGPSVKPYQPSGLWEAVGFVGSNTSIFNQDHGDALYRRSLYTFWKRTSPPPVLSLFDAPNRETCTLLRPRTNTPLQALAMMNDPQMFEASRRLAERVLKVGGQERAGQVALAFRLATARVADASELKVLLDLLEHYENQYREDQESAKKLTSVGESPRDGSLDLTRLAAMTMVGNLILNLDEFLTKG